MGPLPCLPLPGATPASGELGTTFLWPEEALEGRQGRRAGWLCEASLWPLQGDIWPLIESLRFVTALESKLANGFL